MVRLKIWEASTRVVSAWMAQQFCSCVLVTPINDVSSTYSRSYEGFATDQVFLGIPFLRKSASTSSDPVVLLDNSGCSEPPSQMCCHRHDIAHDRHEPADNVSWHISSSSHVFKVMQAYKQLVSKLTVVTEG